jgi:hypothetical protein
MVCNLTQCLEIQQHFGQIPELMEMELHQLLVDIGLLVVVEVEHIPLV